MQIRSMDPKICPKNLVIKSTQMYRHMPCEYYKAHVLLYSEYPHNLPPETRDEMRPTTALLKPNVSSAPRPVFLFLLPSLHSCIYPATF